jgi:hypothetical protein
MLFRPTAFKNQHNLSRFIGRESPYVKNPKATQSPERAKEFRVVQLECKILKI